MSCGDPLLFSQVQLVCVRKLCGNCLCLFLQVSGYHGWRVGYRNGACQLFCSWINLFRILTPTPLNVLSLVNKSLFHISRCFQPPTSCFYVLSCQNYLLCCFFKGSDSFSSFQLSRAEPGDF